MLPARAFSAFGDDLALLVLLLRVYSEGRGPWSIALLLLCATVPVVALAPVAGRLVDSLPFRRLAIATGLWQAALLRGPRARRPALGVYALVIALQAGQVVSNPVWQSLVPSIVGPEEIGQAVGLGQALSTVAAVAAPATAGLLVGTLGYGAPFVVDAVTFARARRRGDRDPDDPHPPGRGRRRNRSRARRGVLGLEGLRCCAR